MFVCCCLFQSQLILVLPNAAQVLILTSFFNVFVTRVSPPPLVVEENAGGTCVPSENIYCPEGSSIKSIPFMQIYIGLQRCRFMNIDYQ